MLLHEYTWVVSLPLGSNSCNASSVNSSALLGVSQRRIHNLLADLHEQVVPIVGAMHVAGPQRGGHAVAVLVEQKQRVVTD